MFGGCDTASHVDIGLRRPPALAFEGTSAWIGRAIQKTGAVADKGPVAPFTSFSEIIDARPEKLSGVGWMIAKCEPDITIMAVLRAEDLARGLCFVRNQNLFFAIVLTDDIKQ